MCRVAACRLQIGPVDREVVLQQYDVAIERVRRPRAPGVVRVFKDVVFLEGSRGFVFIFFRFKKRSLHVIQILIYDLIN